MRRMPSSIGSPRAHRSPWGMPFVRPNASGLYAGGPGGQMCRLYPPTLALWWSRQVLDTTENIVATDVLGALVAFGTDAGTIGVTDGDGNVLWAKWQTLGAFTGTIRLLDDGTLFAAGAGAEFPAINTTTTAGAQTLLLLDAIDGTELDRQTTGGVYDLCPRGRVDPTLQVAILGDTGQGYAHRYVSIANNAITQGATSATFGPNPLAIAMDLYRKRVAVASFNNTFTYGLHSSQGGVPYGVWSSASSNVTWPATAFYQPPTVLPGDLAVLAGGFVYQDGRMWLNGTNYNRVKYILNGYTPSTMPGILSLVIRANGEMIVAIGPDSTGTWQPGIYNIGLLPQALGGNYWLVGAELAGLVSPFGLDYASMPRGMSLQE